MHLLKNKLFIIVLGVLIWRIALLFIGWKADMFLQYKPSFPNVELLKSFGFSRPIYSLGNFDGVHYLTIVDKGYVGTGLIQAFFPGYPLAIWISNLLVNNQIMSSLLISNFFFVVSLIMFWKLLQFDFDKRTSLLTIFALLLFPTSFYFVSSYSESLFLFFVLTSFYFSRLKKWWLVAIFIALASFTRLVGIFLIPAIIIDLLADKSKLPSLKIIKKNLLKILIICLGSIGLGIYMLYLYYEFGDALYFFHVQSEFGAGRQESLVLLPQVIWRYIKILATARPFDLKYFSYVQEFVISILGIFALFASYRKIRISYLVFSIFAIILPTLTGNFSSMPRYILVCFPIFIILSLVLNQSLRSNFGRLAFASYIAISCLLLATNLIMFLQGYWVA